MRATRAQLRRYVADVATELWSLGADLAGEPETLEDATGSLRITVQARLPDAGIPQGALIRIDETWRRRGSEWERDEYAYELVDHPRQRRRAFHLHDAAHFAAIHHVLVHEHCEETLGSSTCHHYAGEPVSDAYAGVDRLLLAWTDDPLGCDDLRCLDDR